MINETRSVRHQHLLDAAVAEVEKAKLDGGMIAVEWVAQRLLDGYLDAPMTLADLQTEIVRIAVASGVGVEFGSAYPQISN